MINNQFQNKIRKIGFIVISVLALLVFMFGGNYSQNQQVDSMINWEDVSWSINNRNSVNNGNASGAPQQQVVNGWTTNDWLELISEQLNEISRVGAPTSGVDNRVARLLLLLVLGACLDWSTRGVQIGERELALDNLHESKPDEMA